MLEFLDYGTLRLIWWVLLGLLIIGFAIMDGFDLGIAILMPLIATRENDKRILLNSIGPFWEGNQAWLILGGGAVFTVWPHVYAVSFSGFYFPMMLILFSMILRPVGFHFRSMINNKFWKFIWDFAITASGFMTAFILGSIVGSVIQGVPFTFNEFMQIEHKIRINAVFNSFSAVCGLLSVLMFTTHGACYLSVKTEGRVLKRVRRALALLPFAVMSVFAIGALFLNFLPCYQIVNFVGTAAQSSPLAKKAVMSFGCLLDNYEKYQWMVIAPILVFLCQSIIPLLIIMKSFNKAFILSSISIFGIIATVGLSMFPFILPSSLNPSASLTIWDASSSRNTMLITLIVTIVFVPIILFYTGVIYKIMNGKVTYSDVKNNLNSY